MNREQKAAVVEELTEQIRSAEAIFAVDYRGISVSDAAALRNRLREAETRFRVVKNSLTERATDKAGAESLRPMLEGPTALAFVSGDAALAAKALSDAARALGTLEFKGGLMDGGALSADDVRAIARLPARDVLNSQLVGTIAAPLSGLVRTLNALIAGLAIQLKQMADEGLVAGGDTAPAPEAATPEVEAPAEVAEGPAAGEAAEVIGEPAAGEAAEVAGEPAAEAAAEVTGAPAAGEAEAPVPEAVEAEPSQEPDTEASDAEASEE